VPDDAGLGDVFFNATGDHLIGTRTGTSQIDSFVVLPGGQLLAAKGSPFTGQGLGQLGAEFPPANAAPLFVSNAHNGAGLGTVSAYRDSFSGQLSPVGSSPYADGQTAPCWVEISHNGAPRHSSQLSLARPARRARDILILPVSWRAGCWPARTGSRSRNLAAVPGGRTARLAAACTTRCASR